MNCILICTSSHTLIVGFWDRDSFRKELSNEVKGNLNPQAAVTEVGDRCYSRIRASFMKGGYSKVLFAYGDHEAG